MLKVAILDDYQNISQNFLNLKELSRKYEFKVFSEYFLNEEEAIEKLKDFEALLIMRERTKITKNLISNLKKLKYIVTSGMRNKAIDFGVAKDRKIIVSGTEINSNPTAELTWAFILGLTRNLKQEIDNMFQGYWQTTVGFELKGKILGLIGLGKVGSQVAKIGKAFGMQVIAWSENLDLSHAKEYNKLIKYQIENLDCVLNSKLFFNDIRQFGYLKIVKQEEKNRIIKKYGLDVNKSNPMKV